MTPTAISLARAGASAPLPRGVTGGPRFWILHLVHLPS